MTSSYSLKPFLLKQLYLYWVLGLAVKLRVSLLGIPSPTRQPTQVSSLDRRRNALRAKDLKWPVHTCFRNGIICIQKQDKLYPETETLYPETGYFVSGNRILCVKKQDRPILFSFSATKSRFRIQSCRFRIQFILFPDIKYPVSETSVDRP